MPRHVLDTTRSSLAISVKRTPRFATSRGDLIQHVLYALLVAPGCRLDHGIIPVNEHPFLMLMAGERRVLGLGSHGVRDNGLTIWCARVGANLSGPALPLASILS
jgi:hypothetical protein